MEYKGEYFFIFLLYFLPKKCMHIILNSDICILSSFNWFKSYKIVCFFSSYLTRSLYLHQSKNLSSTNRKKDSKIFTPWSNLTLFCPNAAIVGTFFKNGHFWQKTSNLNAFETQYLSDVIYFLFLLFEMDVLSYLPPFYHNFENLTLYGINKTLTAMWQSKTLTNFHETWGN